MQYTFIITIILNGVLLYVMVHILQNKLIKWRIVMNKKIFVDIIFVIILCFSSCSKQITQNNTEQVESTTTEEKVIPQELLDDSEMKTDISNILDENIS